MEGKQLTERLRAQLDALPPQPLAAHHHEALMRVQVTHHHKVEEVVGVRSVTVDFHAHLEQVADVAEVDLKKEKAGGLLKIHKIEVRSYPRSRTFWSQTASEIELKGELNELIIKKAELYSFF